MSDPTTVLAIDTSGPRLQLAVVAGARADMICEELPKGHAEIIFERIDALLSGNGLVLGDIQRIAVTTGPGSFTGLRIGLSAARGLGLGLKIPVIGVPTLVAMSLAVRASEPFTLVVDARREQAYIQKFSSPGKPLAPAQLKSTHLLGNDHIVAKKSDIIALARFAVTADVEAWPANPLYVRDADAKPQTKGIVALQATAP